jgi:hypothetical protein
MIRDYTRMHMHTGLRYSSNLPGTPQGDMFTMVGVNAGEKLHRRADRSRTAADITRGAGDSGVDEPAARRTGAPAASARRDPDALAETRRRALRGLADLPRPTRTLELANGRPAALAGRSIWRRRGS